MLPPVPDGFVGERIGRRLTVLRGDLRAELLRAGLDAPWSVLAGSPDAPGGGRGHAAVIELGSGPVRVKQYRHGGALRHLTGGWFVGADRMLDDLAASEHLRARAVPTVEALGVVVRWRVGGWTEGYHLAREIDGARDGFVRLGSTHGDRDRLIASAAATVRAMHDAGVRHADLNLRNLLVEAGPGGEQVRVIDLDRARVETVDLDARAANLARLERSVDKLGRDRPLISRAERKRFLDAYCRHDEELARELGGRLRRARSRQRWHRLGWRLSGRNP